MFVLKTCSSQCSEECVLTPQDDDTAFFRGLNTQMDDAQCGVGELRATTHKLYWLYTITVMQSKVSIFLQEQIQVLDLQL